MFPVFIWVIQFSLLQMSLCSQHCSFMIVVHSIPLAYKSSLIWYIHLNFGLPNGHFLFLFSSPVLLLVISIMPFALTCPNHSNLSCSIYLSDDLILGDYLISIYLILCRLVFPSMLPKILISAVCTLLLSFFVNIHVSSI